MKYLLSIFLLIISSFKATAQKYLGGSIPVVTEKKVYLTSNRQEHILSMPVVSPEYPRLKDSLSEKRLFDGYTLKENIARYRKNNRGINNLHYVIPFQNQSIICLSLYFHYFGPQERDDEKWLTFNIHTGEHYRLDKAINKAGLKWITQNYKAILKQRIETEFLPNISNFPNNIIHSTLISACNALDAKDIVGNYVFTKTGIKLTTNQALSYADSGYEPDRSVFYSYRQLKPYLVLNSLLLK